MGICDEVGCESYYCFVLLYVVVVECFGCFLYWNVIFGCVLIDEEMVFL